MKKFSGFKSWKVENVKFRYYIRQMIDYGRKHRTSIKIKIEYPPINVAASIEGSRIGNREGESGREKRLYIKVWPYYYRSS